MIAERTVSQTLHNPNVKELLLETQFSQKSSLAQLNTSVFILWNNASLSEKYPLGQFRDNGVLEIYTFHSCPKASG